MSDEKNTPEGAPDAAQAAGTPESASPATAGSVAEAPTVPQAQELSAETLAPEATVPDEGPIAKPSSAASAQAAGSAEEIEFKGGRSARKVRVGIVTSDKQQKTITVAVERKVPHPLYGKFIKKTTKFAAHDEKEDAGIGDIVRIMETRPLSKRKRWRLVEVLERAK